MSIYNLEAVKSPRLCGILLDVISRILRFPIIGSIILTVIKRKNKINQMVQFASSYHPCCQEDDSEGSSSDNLQLLLPLYYPIHEMTAYENDMHKRMVRECPLDLQQLAVMNTSMSSSTNDDGGEQFKHWTISDYTSKYKNKEKTPSQVVERIISFISEMNEQNNNKSIVTHINVKELRSQATESTKRYQNGNTMGVLDGVPILVKDEIPVLGFPVTLGTSFLSDTVEKDIYPITKLKEHGALIVGKTNQHEMGIGTTGFNLLHGTPRNPYGIEEHYTGGSSCGSAAAVSMGLVPLAVGADGGGSIRIPAGLCGCIGLKPTFKRIAFDSTVGASVCHIGPMTNNVHDAALSYTIMAGAAHNDHRHQSQHQPPVHLHSYMSHVNNDVKSDSTSSLKGLRIGIFEEHIVDADEAVLNATRKAIDSYQSKGARIIQITLPNLREIHLAHGITITTEMFAMLEQHYYSKHFYELCPETRVSIAMGKSWSASEFLSAQKIRSYAMQHIEDLFENKVDIILSPATPCVAPSLKKDVMSHGESNLAQTSTLMRYVIHGNFTGIPAIVFPISYDCETGLPISLQIQSAHWREDLLFRVARESQCILKGGIAKPVMYVDTLGERHQ